ncbi:hypothetical protein Bpfe_026504, partial [Biomphalaria pfeifferi]
MDILDTYEKYNYRKGILNSKASLKSLTGGLLTHTLTMDLNMDENMDSDKLFDDVYEFCETIG